MREFWFESKLFAVEQGDGPPVILLHGGLGTHVACAPLAASLAERGIRAITPDLRGSGRSHDAGPLSWDQLADDVVALAGALGLERVAVGGTSLGSGVAVRVALRHPARVTALVAIHPVFAGADVGLAPAPEAAMRAMVEAGCRAPREGVGVLLPLFDALPAEMRERARALVATYDPASVAATTHFMRYGGQPFERAAELAAIAAPAFVVPGIDATHPADVADVYRRHLPRCTVAPDPSGLADFLLSARAR